MWKCRRNSLYSLALYQLSDYLYRYYGKKVIIFLDEFAFEGKKVLIG